MTAILRTGDVVSLPAIYPTLFRDLIAGLAKRLRRWAT